MKSVRRLSSLINLHDLPLAWLQLKRQPVRYLVAVTGIGFAALLMFMQLGFQSGLLRSATTFYQALETDLILINPATVNSGSYQQFPQSLLYQALGIEGVEKTIPLYVTNINAQQLGGVKPTSLRVIGFDPNETILDVPAINDQRDLLKTPNFVLFDELGLSIKTGPVAKQFSKEGPLELILSNFSQSFRVMGLFKLGSTFVADSNLIASQATALELAFPQVNLGEISLGLIRLDPSANISQIQNYLKSLYGDQLQVLTKEELITQERNYWNNVSSFGVIFGFGTIMGLLVGGVVVYQVLYTDVSDHLKEYATLKAMGYSNRFIEGVVISEAVILSMLAVIPALIFSSAMLAILGWMSGLSTGLDLNQIIQISLFSLGMCCFSAILALGKIRRLDPAELF